ncbi:MAG: hypothetical protein IKY70_03620 [Bacteroidales bacterium]|nr:hypothetical protein [Bacteroidales bacterium]
MRRVYLLVTMAVTALFLISSCTKSEEPKIEIVASSSSLDVSKSSVSFTVNSNVAWTLTQSGNGNFTVSPKSGEAGSTTVTVSAAGYNNTGSVVTSTLTVTGSSAVATILVTQAPVEFSLSAEVLQMDAKESTKSITVTSNTEWSINTSNKPDWIKSIAATATSGNGEIEVTVNDSKNRKSENSYQFRVTYGGTMSKSIEIKQDKAKNNAPSKPTDLQPADKATDVSMIPNFSWTKSTDADGDAITYQVYLSENGTTWQKFSAGKSTSVSLPSSMGTLKTGVTYYYKVSADDGYEDGVTESDVQTFTVSDSKDVYLDGEYVTYMESSKPNPVVLVFTGDGYLQQHYKFGGQFDNDIDSAIEGFFSIEPYKSYREYFTVYKIAAYSKQTGISNKSKSEYKDTKFKLEWEGGNSTGISCDYELVKDWVMKIPGVTYEVLKKGAIGVISNANVYAGTCAAYSDGVSISMIPYFRSSTNSMTNFKNVVVHEMGGHGFGRLGDEYKYYSEAAPASETKRIVEYQTVWSYPFYLNLSVYPEQSKSNWAHFEGLEDYSHVGMFEGGGLYYQGIWRPEQISCMDDNRMYYNSPSRFYIVKRILEVAGEVEPFSQSYSPEEKAQKIAKVMERFLERDVQKADPNAVKGWQGVPYDFVPLGRPVLIDVN